MSGAGFLCSTTSPASKVEPGGTLGPAACSRMARTDGSAEVEATPRVHPASCASPMIRRMPGRVGSVPASTMSV